ncbi:phage tail protein [Bradyrhizobium niftali]|uniref:Phage tail protein n=1 Tax=Bradyrhizobium niftali TaxID=2560055 RepID=A0A4Y9M379_9BRAD|nr:phage tail protein [Bradyrhizobium niftali]TFV49636.1 phage tail protein [Bradyrhizobium niftali]
MAAIDARNDPYRAFNYEVDFGDKTSAGFSEVSGLVADGDHVDYREGTDRFNHVRRLPALRKYPNNLVLKRGYTKNINLWTMAQQTALGKTNRRDVIITLKDEEHNPVMRWKVMAAWVNKIEGPSLKASGNEVAMESVELCFESISVELVGGGA